MRVDRVRRPHSIAHLTEYARPFVQSTSLYGAVFRPKISRAEKRPRTPSITQSQISASLFGTVLGLAGLGQAWRIAARLWHAPTLIGNTIALGATVLWLCLLIAYVVQAFRRPHSVMAEFERPVDGAAPALLSIATLSIVQTVLPWSHRLAWALTIVGLAWHMLFALWHTGTLWKGERVSQDTTPVLYLPTVASSFTSAAALGALGRPDWAWIFMGIGVLSWLALESIVIRRLWHGNALPAAQRPQLGIQFAPPVVCAAALLLIEPGFPVRWILMLLGYGLFQMLVGLRLWSWMTSKPFAMSWWAYTFGIVSATAACMKLALDGVPAAHEIVIPVFLGANIFIAYLSVQTAMKVLRPESSIATKK